MKKNNMFYIVGAIFILGFLGILIWMQNKSDDQRKLNNSYNITLFSGSNITIGDIELYSISKSTQLSENSSTDFLIPVIQFKNNLFRIPIYGVNNMRMYFDEEMYDYNDRLLDEEKFSKSNTDSYSNLKSQLNKTINCDCNDLNNSSNNQIFIIDELFDGSNNIKNYWKSLVSLKLHIDSLIKTKEIIKDSKIEIYFCNGHSVPESKPIIELSIDTPPIVDVSINKEIEAKPPKKPKKNKELKDLVSVTINQVDPNGNTFKITTSNRRLNIKDKVDVISSISGIQVDSKHLSSSELISSSFYIPGNTYKDRTSKSSLDIEIKIKINGKKFNLGEFSIFCNK